MKYFDEDGNELTGDAIPYHLRNDAPPLATCTVCKRKTWAGDDVGKGCGMRQPSGVLCGGRFVP